MDSNRRRVMGDAGSSNTQYIQFPTETGLYIMRSDGTIDAVLFSGNNTPLNITSSDVCLVFIELDSGLKFAIPANNGADVVYKKWYNTNTGSQSAGSSIINTYQNTSLQALNAWNDYINTYKQKYIDGDTGVSLTNSIVSYALADSVTENECAALYCKNKTFTLPDGRIAHGFLPCGYEYAYILKLNYLKVSNALGAISSTSYNSNSSLDFWTSNVWVNNSSRAVNFRIFGKGRTGYVNPLLGQRDKTYSNVYAYPFYDLNNLT